jgi:hypothetical protein
MVGRYGVINSRLCCCLLAALAPARQINKVDCLLVHFVRDIGKGMEGATESGMFVPWHILEFNSSIQPFWNVGDNNPPFLIAYLQYERQGVGGG